MSERYQVIEEPPPPRKPKSNQSNIGKNIKRVGVGLGVVTLTALGFKAAYDAGQNSKQQTPTPTDPPTFIPTEARVEQPPTWTWTPLPTLNPVEAATVAPPPPEPIAPLDLFAEIDLANILAVEQALPDEQVTLIQPLVRDVFRLAILPPLPFIEIEQPIFATLADANGNVYALMENADCLFKGFRDDELLGRKSRSYEGWRPEIRVGDLAFDVYIQSAIGLPWPILTVRGVTHNGRILDCTKHSQLGAVADRLKGFVENSGDLIKGFVDDLGNSFND